MKHLFGFNQFIAMITSHQITYLCKIRTGKMEMGIRQRGRIERQSNGLREREREH
jgi:hypothetical protein